MLWEQHYGRLPKFLQFFVEQNWFKKLFPIFTLQVRGSLGSADSGGGSREAGAPGMTTGGGARQAYPEMGTVEGLASAFMDLLEEASWADRVHVLRALLRLLPDLSREFCSRLQGTLLRLLNLEQPPSLQVSALPRASPAPPRPAPPQAWGTDLSPPVLRTGSRSSL